MTKKNFYVVLPILLFIVIVLAVIYVADRSFLNNKANNIDDKNNITENQLSLVMVGDAIAHAPIYKEAKIDENKYDFRYIFEYIKPIIKKYDLAFYNQETIIGGKHLGLSSYPLFNTPEEFGDAFVDMGFNIVSLANNHTLDKGEKGIINSLNYWKTKDVLTAGSYLSFDERVKDNIKKKNNITYTLLSYTVYTNGLKVPKGKDYLVDIFDYDKVKADVERLRDKVDLLIVSMHWGYEYSNTPNQQQKEIATFLASLGVDIVIGHHPHVIQPIEYIDGTLVLYSLGNFVSAQIGTDRLTGMIASLKISKEVNNDITTINFSDLEVTFIYTYYDKNYSNFKVIPFDQITTDHLVNYKEIYNKYYSIVTSLDNSIMVTKLNED